MSSERAVILFSGHVQGVGFRYTCRHLANGFTVTGYVRNLSDGRVELALEGERDEIEEFLREIDKSHLKPFIREQQIDWQPATGEWPHFRIEH
jgi:acylphosphatase